jgi:ABC-type nitrate/sulfonate/bicarbonate transport system permease component
MTGPRLGRTARLALTSASVIAFVVVWNVSGAIRLLPFFPTMPQVADAIVEDAQQLIDGALATTTRALLGLVVGTSLGVLLALSMAWSRDIKAVADPYVTLMKSIPGMALIPVFILWFGLAEAARVGFVATLTFFVIFVATAEAIPNVPRVYGWAASTLGAGRADSYFHVVLPAVLPNMFGGLRNAVTLSFAVAVAAEFIGAQSGLGWYIVHVGINYEVDAMVAGVIAITLLAVVFDVLLVAIQSRVLRWSERT